MSQGENEEKHTSTIEEQEASSTIGDGGSVAENPILAELENAKKEIASLKDSWLRERAEFQNYKKRSSMESLQLKKTALKDLISQLLTPIDNLDRVSWQDVVSDEFKPFVDGVEMIKKEFTSVLERLNVNKFSPVGSAFDPFLMEAINSEESEQYTEELVIEVYQSGYLLKDNEEKVIIRPARVKVGKPIVKN